MTRVKLLCSFGYGKLAVRFLKLEKICIPCHMIVIFGVIVRGTTEPLLLWNQKNVSFTAPVLFRSNASLFP